MGPEITKPIHPPPATPILLCGKFSTRCQGRTPVSCENGASPGPLPASGIRCVGSRVPGSQRSRMRVKFLPVIAEVDGFLLPSREGLILTIHLQSRGWGSGARYENLPSSPTPPPIPPASGWCYLRESSPHPLLARSVVRLGGGSEGGCNCERKCLGCTCLWLSFVFK